MTGDLDGPDQVDIRIEDVLSALADPIRLSIVTTLAANPDGIACGLLDVPVTKSTLTHHLRTLREAGVTRSYYRGTSRISVLRRECLDARFPGLLGGVLEGVRNRQNRAPSVS